MGINVTEATDKIGADFVSNRTAVMKSLLTNPTDPYLQGQADALGVPFVSVAQLVAHGAATILKDIATKQLQTRLDAEPKDVVPSKSDQSPNVMGEQK